LITACLILKAPRIGKVKTRLANDIGARQATAIYRTLVERQTAQIPNGWDVAVFFTPTDAEAEMKDWLTPCLPANARFSAQVEGDLGQRMAAAVHTEFGNGSTEVFLIGGDCPGLNRQYLLQAAVALETNEIVIGPALDGGYVLLGLKRCTVGRYGGLFENITWSSSAVLEQALAAARQQNLSVALLQPLADIDDAASLKAHPELIGIVGP
jgi:rSAM/selenodomain-associated transferase 1